VTWPVRPVRPVRVPTVRVPVSLHPGCGTPPSRPTRFRPHPGITDVIRRTSHRHHTHRRCGSQAVRCTRPGPSRHRRPVDRARRRKDPRGRDVRQHSGARIRSLGGLGRRRGRRGHRPRPPDPLVVADLSKVTFIDSTALGVLIGARERCAGAGMTMRLVVAEPRILKIFDITGLTELFDIRSTRAEAVQP